MNIRKLMMLAATFSFASLAAPLAAPATAQSLEAEMRQAAGAYEGKDMATAARIWKTWADKGNAEDDNGSGSSADVPADPKDDIQLNEAIKLLRGEVANAAFPPDPKKGVLN